MRIIVHDTVELLKVGVKVKNICIAEHLNALHKTIIVWF